MPGLVTTRFVWRHWLIGSANFTLTATSEDVDWPVENLFIVDPFAEWHSAAVNVNQTVTALKTINPTVHVTVDFIALVRHNIPSETVSAAYTTNGGSSWISLTTNMSGSDYVRWHDLGVGTGVTGNGFRFTVAANAGHPDGYFGVGVFWLGQSFEIGAGWLVEGQGRSLTVNEGGAVAASSLTGAVFGSKRRYDYIDATVRYPALSRSDLDSMLSMMRAVGHTLPVIVIINTTPQFAQLADIAIEDGMGYVVGFRAMEREGDRYDVELDLRQFQFLDIAGG